MLKQLLFMVTLSLFLVSPSYAAQSHHTTTPGVHHSQAKSHSSHKTSPKLKHTLKKTLRSKKTAPKHKINTKTPKKHHLTTSKQHVRHIETKAGSLNPIVFASNIAQKLIALVQTTIHKQTSNHYKLGGTYFNTHKGVYEIDCSAYVDHMLNNACPIAYRNIKYWTNSEKPTSHDYYSFFNNLPDKGISRNWYRVSEVESLQAGDILVFHKRGNQPGHVMIVTHKPAPFHGLYNAYAVQVSDSAPSGHSNDTRPPHTSGVGIGTLLLRVNIKTGEPYAYAWKLGSNWKYDMDFAMARPTVNTTRL